MESLSREQLEKEIAHLRQRHEAGDEFELTLENDVREEYIDGIRHVDYGPNQYVSFKITKKEATV